MNEKKGEMKRKRKRERGRESKRERKNRKRKRKKKGAVLLYPRFLFLSFQDRRGKRLL